jgi:tetratricopeptide (TPR) repeat protein
MDGKIVIYRQAVMKLRFATLLLPLVLACSKAPPEKPPVLVVPPSPPPAAVVASAAPVIPTAEPEVQPPPESAGMDCSEAAFQAALKDLEAAKASGEGPDETKLKLLRALEIRPRDVALRSQLARLHWNAGDLDSATIQAQILVELGNDAFAWTILGMEAQKRGAAEEARAYLARAARIDPKGEGAKLLGSRSRCTGMTQRTSNRVSSLEIVNGWLEVFRRVDQERMVREEKPEPKTEAEARERTCINGTLNEITERNVCKGPGPWEVQTGHMHFHDHRVIIVPLPRNRFAVISYFTGEGCRGGIHTSARLQGNVVEVNSSSNTVVVSEVSACDDGPHDSMTPPCITGSVYESLYYDARNGDLLLRIEEHDRAEKHELKGMKLQRTEGNDCKETIDLMPLTK